MKNKDLTVESDAVSPVTSLTVFHFAPGARLWAFAQMGLARPLLRHIRGLRFHRLMGAGRGLGFTVAPDWGRYAFLAVWNNEEQARGFLASSALMRRYRRRATHANSVLLRTLSAHGAWDGINPFLPTIDAANYGGPIAVLTRATIRPWRLPPFWRRMQQVNAHLEQTAGRVASIGIGEAPFVRQATFSIWQDAALMQQFAYRSADHRQTIRQTRAEHWYSEELFARFTVIEQTEQFP